MKRYYSYLNTAKKIISAYKGELPFSAYLKIFFSTDKRYGSKDRKMIAHLCYGYFRLGKMAEEHDTEEKILLGLILCAYDPDEMLTILKPEWSMLTGLTPQQKMDQCGLGFSLSQIFPWKHEMSIGIAHDTFCASFLIQPDLFLRLRPGYEERVKHKLTTAQIPFSVVHPGCIALQNSSKIDSLVELDKEAVVQDLNSQKISDVFKMTRPMGYGEPVRVWDCCAASGGKSLMFHDMFPVARLTVSDIRESILINLRKRFTKAGIHHYESFIADLTAPLNKSVKGKYQLIIADVPCSGSGTWSRTPEQLTFFEESRINEYNSLQKKIVSHVIPFLDTGGFLLYITCSVFKPENEDVVAFIRQDFDLELIQMDLFKGYDKRADTLFAALFRQPL